VSADRRALQGLAPWKHAGRRGPSAQGDPSGQVGGEQHGFGLGEVGAANPDLLSRQLMVVFEGGQAQSLVAHSSKPALDARGIAKLLIDAALAR
jgi:hypothetical protein